MSIRDPKDCVKICLEFMVANNYTENYGGECLIIAVESCPLCIYLLLIFSHRENDLMRKHMRAWVS